MPKKMVKQRPRPTSREPGNNLQEDWTLVKKQKITILIPPLPNDEGRLKENPGTSNSQSFHETQKPKSSSPKQDSYRPSIAHPHKPNFGFQRTSGLSHSIASDNSPISGQGNGQKGNLMIFSNVSAFPDRMMRASCLANKLNRAGGLEKWLVSLGLSHFVSVFRARSMNRFQLVNLTMKKLKDMGTEAVGPRRKLLHAIDCLCEPHCFQHA